MNYRSLLLLIAGLCIFHNQSNAKDISAKNKIVIEIELPVDFRKDYISIGSMPYDYVGSHIWEIGKADVKDNFVKWTIFSDRPLIVDLRSVLGKGSLIQFYEPGDSVHIDLKYKSPIYSGINADKFNMLEKMFEKEALLPIPKNTDFGTTNSLEDYQQWNYYLNAQLLIMDSVMTAYKEKMTPLAYDYLKMTTVIEIEYQRLMKFDALTVRLMYEGTPGEKLGEIFDATAHGVYAKWLHAYTGKIRNEYYFYDFIRKSVQRKYNFNFAHESLKDAGRKVQYVDLGRKMYKGLALEGFLSYLLTSRGLKDVTLKKVDPEIEALLEDYYSSPEYPEYKAYVKKYEEWIRIAIIQKNGNAPDFSLEDVNGKLYSLKDFKGKLVLINFFDDSNGSIEMKTSLKKVQQTFDFNPNVVFLNITTEKNKAKWRADIFNSNDKTKNAIDLYTDGEAKNYQVLKYYNIQSYPKFNIEAYPKVFLLNSNGDFVYFGEVYWGVFADSIKLTPINKSLPDPRKDNGEKLINKINEQLALMNDGPYVFHEKGDITAISIQSANAIEKKYAGKSKVGLIAQTDDIRKTFPIKLKSVLKIEPFEFVKPAKLFVLSDVEGNFDAFRKLLQANKIIDDQFNWIFGNDHLVFAGDMFDRGLQVTECLWLVYVLEEKAKAAGGYVHFVLGNHEIMNLQGDHRYVEDKYKENAKLMDKTLTQLYNEDSELGRWLRTKNIVEKIGDLLFMHGGFSQELNNQPLSVEQMNAIARPFYADNKAAENVDTRISQLYKSATSPFWYRLYYEKDRFSKSQNKWVYGAKESQVDSTLRKFDVKHIVTGHTIVADTISIHYGGKVINTDTKHRAGKSEALLIEGNNFYRVNSEGKRMLLFRDEEK